MTPPAARAARPLRVAEFTDNYGPGSNGLMYAVQQLEGNLIYPKLVGTSIGLPGVWVLAAITVGGGMLGIVGMLLSVPIVATLYRLLQSDIRQRSGKERAKKSDVSPKE